MDKKQAETIKVGQTIYSLNVGNSARRGTEQVLTEYVITKVGRKYFWIQHKEHKFIESQFYIDSLNEKTEYISDHRLFLNPEDYYELKRRCALLAKIQNFFSRLGKTPDISTDALDHICQIIDEEAV